MPTLLQIDSSPLGESSISRRLTREFAENWKAAHPDGKVITRDVTTTEIAPIGAAWVGAVYTPVEARTAEQNATLSLSDELIAELETADEYVIGVPMHNFSIPSTLRLWLDQVLRAGKTFSYAGGTPEGLLKGKKVTVLVASGGVYDEGTAMASFNFVEPYLRTVLAFIGVKDTNFINAGGTAALNFGNVDRQEFLAPHLQTIRSQFHAA
jgi:FMN-dependent NADH-azoreductase